ncbi:hypothetical protein CEXT_104871 [Caerostris extrusa]|uniref:Uncharacterized protein n=1 Tax=Caerostris extrusa TaxID=172846 RepID=A0AAV4XWF6_CAEEX|nr:hypothetical protein CEXT_104871 [Caerostris extrusa]
MSCFPPVRRHEECPRSFFRQRILLKQGVKKKGFVRFECSELFVLSRRRAICSLDHRNQDESTRDNLCILDDICLSSSTNRDLFPPTT